MSVFALVGSKGQRVPLDQIGKAEIRMEDPILRRRDRLPTITVRGDVGAEFQPPAVSAQVMQALKPITQALPAGYRIEMGADIEEAGKANAALAAVFPLSVHPDDDRDHLPGPKGSEKITAQVIVKYRFYLRIYTRKPLTPAVA